MGERNFVFYNPPVINRQLGIRRGAVNETRDIAGKLLANGIPTIVFARSRIQVEVLTRYMVIPAAAKNKENAEKFIDFMSRPDIAKMNCEKIWYSSPNTGAIELMGDTYINNLTMNPTQDIVDRCEFFHDIQDFIQIYNAMLPCWMKPHRRTCFSVRTRSEKRFISMVTSIRSSVFFPMPTAAT